VGKKDESYQLENAKKLTQLAENCLIEWFNKKEETGDIKNLNYAITCLKRIVETWRLINISDSIDISKDEVNDGNSGRDFDSLTKAISQLIEELREENGSENSTQDKA